LRVGLHGAAGEKGIPFIAMCGERLWFQQTLAITGVVPQLTSDRIPNFADGKPDCRGCGKWSART